MHTRRPADGEGVAAPLRLPRGLLESVLEHARTSPRREVCGLIARDRNGRWRRYPVDNVADQPEVAFEMDPRQQIGAFRRMRERGETLLAIYHSHPDSPARPSARDLAAHRYPEALCLIVSLSEPRPRPRAWRIGTDGAVPVPLEVSGGWRTVAPEWRR
ncbi:MAG TPA: M67 family metallopeptidase [Gammaproteobacteria bacterium]|nr:M67 family metallopeptidase [Gammaproteobacteria bacterium]